MTETREHVLSKDCWCQPTVEYIKAGDDPVERVRELIAESAETVEKLTTLIGPIWMERDALRREAGRFVQTDERTVTDSQTGAVYVLDEDATADERSYGD